VKYDIIRFELGASIQWLIGEVRLDPHHLPFVEWRVMAFGLYQTVFVTTHKEMKI
jgi:hypothetical protein